MVQTKPNTFKVFHTPKVSTPRNSLFLPPHLSKGGMPVGQMDV